MNAYSCPCCGYPTLAEKPPGTFAVCPVCFWEDDDVQYRAPTYAGGANRVSLEEARRNYAAFGASAMEWQTKVRPPTSEEQAHRR